MFCVNDFNEGLCQRVNDFNSNLEMKDFALTHSSSQALTLHMSVTATAATPYATCLHLKDIKGGASHVGPTGKKKSSEKVIFQSTCIEFQKIVL